MRFSVIICTYNAAELLPDALRSVAAQSLKDFELIVVDDGSSDGTGEVVSRFRSSLGDFKYLKRNHEGLAHARNAGVRAATGTHIAWLDADDLWFPDYLRSMQEAIEAHPQAEIVCCDGLKFEGEGIVIGSLFPNHFPRLGGALRNADEYFFVLLHTLPSGTVISRALFDRVGPLDARFRIELDGHWMMRAANAGAACVALDRKLVLYRRHGNNLTNQKERAFDEWLLDYSETLKQSADPQIHNRARRFTVAFATAMMAQCPRAASRQLLDKAVAVFEGDGLLKAVRAANTVGLPKLLAAVGSAKRFLKGLRPAKRRIDLQAIGSAVTD